MPYQSIKYQKESSIARIIMNRPEAMNAITPEMLKELNSAVIDAGNDREIKVIVLTGAGKAFCAGVDLKALGDRKIENGKVGDILDIPARELIHSLCTVPKVVIAAVNGFCFTGALEIMLGCDIVIASEDAKIGDTHAKWSLRPTWGMTARLPRRVGYLKAREMSYTAEAISGKEAERIGLVNIAVPAGMLDETVFTFAKKIISNSHESVAAYKELYYKNENLGLDKSLELEFSSDFIIGDTEQRLAQFRK